MDYHRPAYSAISSFLTLNSSTNSMNLSTSSKTLLTLLFFATACGTPTVEEEQTLVRTVNVEVETLQPQEFKSTLKLVGSVKAENDAVVSAEVSGRLNGFPYPKGEVVQKGTVIAVLDDAKLKQEVNRMEAMLLQAKEAYENQKTLFENKIGSETQLNNAKYVYDQQRAALESMRIDLGNTQIKAPFSGRIEKTFIEVGELVNPGMAVVRISDSEDLKIEVGVPSRYAGTLKKGDSVEFWINRDESRRFTGTITFVGSAVDPASRTFDVEVSFPNTENVMKIDMVAEVEFTTEVRPSSIVVGEEFLFSSGENMVAYVVDEDENGNPISREVVVETGSVHESDVVILSGLQAGDRFIKQGSSYLNDGTRIIITNP